MTAHTGQGAVAPRFWSLRRWWRNHVSVKRRECVVCGRFFRMWWPEGGATYVDANFCPRCRRA